MISLSDLEEPPNARSTLSKEAKESGSAHLLTATDSAPGECSCSWLWSENVTHFPCIPLLSLLHAVCV